MLRFLINYEMKIFRKYPYQLQCWHGASQLHYIVSLIVTESHSWHVLVATVQRSHYKSSNMHKLGAAVTIYTGLAPRLIVRNQATERLCSMLLHPYPTVSAPPSFLLCPVRVAVTRKRPAGHEPCLELTMKF